jgi:S1-C subfamily serine protease
VPPRPPDWLLYLGAAAALLGVALLGQMLGGPPSAAPPAAGPASGAGSASRTLPPASAFDPTITVDAPAAGAPATGTAFSISSGGFWLTARHVVEGCPRAAIVVGPGQGVAAEVRTDPRGETAVLITQGGAPALPMAPRQDLKRGMMALHAGFPGGHPGEVVSRLLRRETLVLRGRRTRRESVLAWVQADGGGADSEDGAKPIPASLAGLSGAPALDSRGRVIGVTIAQSRRRGQIYTTTPAALRAALYRAHIEPATGARAAPMSEGSYARIAAALRRDLRIVPVVCLGR